MTISSTVSRVDYTGNGSTSVYSFSFVIQKKEDIELTEKNTAGVETVLVQDTNYTVQLNDDGTGSITLLAGNLTTNHILSILRKVQIKQETDLRNQGEFFAETHESMADYAVMIDQQQQDEISRCIKNPTTTSNSSFEPTLPTTLAGNANRALVTNSSGNGFDVGPTTDQIQNASTSAANAATSATNAATSATNAATSESNAATSATNASTSATSASASASTATSKAGEASTSASNASTSATNAATSEANASTSASTATTKASEASTSATNAATSETNASASASTATTKAGEASTSASNAATSATNAATSATNAASSATAAQNAANNVIWNDVQFFTTSNSPLTVGNSHRGAMLAIDCSSGDFVVNLPQISNLDLSTPYVVAIKKTDNSGNKVTINRASTDTIDGNTSVIIQNPDTGYICIPDTDPNPDEWTTQIYGAVTGDNTVDTFTGDGSTTNFTLSVAPGNKNNVQVYINNQYQNQSDYSVSNTTLTFNSAPANSSTIECVTGTTVSIGVPADGSVTSQKLDTNIAVGGVISIAGGSEGSPSLAHTGDTNTGVFFPANDVVGIATNGTERLRIDSSGKVGIGETSPDHLLHIKSTGDAAIKIEADSDNANEDDNAYIEFSQDGGLVTGYVGYDTNTNDITIANNHTSANLTFKTDELERMRIDSSGNVGIGTSSPTSLLDIASGGSAIMRVTSAGSLLLHYTSEPSLLSTGYGLSVNPSTQLTIASSNKPVAYFNRTDSSSSGGTLLSFRLNGTQEGSITITSTATSYNTTSDYRLKENVTPIIDGITRLMELKPSRFNFKKNKNKTVDGFLAHEVQDIIPEAITGQKDAVDKDGKPEYQSIDQSKIVPLLTASLQQLVKRVEELEKKIKK